jgi:peptidylprolyl isomerase
VGVKDAVAEAVQDAVPVQLVSVFGDAGSLRALVRLENGKYQQFRVGDPLNGGMVTAIEKTAMRFERNGENVELMIALRELAETETPPTKRFGLAPGDLGLRIEVTGSGATGTVVIDLFEDVAPGHAQRIAELARSGAYDGVIWHRVIDDFMAQTGDVRFGDITEKTFTISQSGRGGSEMPDLKAEFSDLPFERGVVGMARAGNPDSANSQFFIMFKDGPFLNGQYTVIGKVIEGMDVVDQIKRGDNSSWVTVGEPDRMARVTVIE